MMPLMRSISTFSASLLVLSPAPSDCLGHLFRPVLANCGGIWKLAQEELGQGAITGSDINNSNGKLLIVGNRLRQDSKWFLPGFLFLVLA